MGVGNVRNMVNVLNDLPFHRSEHRADAGRLAFRAFVCDCDRFHEEDRTEKQEARGQHAGKDQFLMRLDLLKEAHECWLMRLDPEGSPAGEAAAGEVRRFGNRSKDDGRARCRRGQGDIQLL